MNHGCGLVVSQVPLVEKWFFRVAMVDDGWEACVCSPIMRARVNELRIQRIERYIVVAASLLLALLAGFIFLKNLGASSISLYSDEVIYVRVTQGILHDGAWFPLKHGKVPMFEKPPLKLWLSAIGPMVLGESNWSFRLLDGLLGIAAVLLSVVVTQRIFGSMALALAVGFLTLGMPEWVLAQHGFRRAVLDGLLTVLTLGTAWSAWRVIEGAERGAIDRWGLPLIAAFSSLAVLTKSVAGFVPLGVAVLSIAVVSRRELLTKRALVLLMPFVVFACYVGCVAITGGSKGLSIFLGVEILHRAFSGFQGHNTGSPWYYAWYLLVRGGGPPRLLLAIGLVATVIAAWRDRRFRFVLVWGLLPVVVYSAAASRVPWYISPFLPFVCMIAVCGSVNGVQELVRRTRRPRVVAPLLALALLLTLPPYGRAIARNLREVTSDTTRLEVDRLMEEMQNRYAQFTIVGDSLSGRSNPRNGRFNVEGIYREMLRPQLTSVLDPSAVTVERERVYFVKESDLSRIPQGWVEVGRAAPTTGRAWLLVAVVYP